MKFNEDPVVASVKAQITARSGPNALKAAIRYFRAMDANGDGTLSPVEFSDGLGRLGVKLTAHNAAYLMRAMDANGDGRVSLEEFLRVLIGGMNPRRTKLVDRAFAKFDRTGDGKVTVADLKGCFDASRHPLVQRGVKKEEDVLAEFLSGFDDPANPDGVVTREEFHAYYAALSSGIPHDDVFEAMMLRCWDLDEAPRPRLNATRREWGPAGDPLEIKDPLVATAVLSHTLGASTKGYNYSHMARQPAPHVPNPSVRPDWITVSKRDYPAYTADEILCSDPTYKKVVAASVTGNPIVDAVRAKVLRRAASEGFLALRRCLRLLGKGRGASLSKSEVDAAMRHFGVPLTPLELDTIMTFFDPSGTGVVSVAELLRGVRGPLTQQRRLKAIRAAYARLGSGSSAVVTLGDVVNKYDASKHPAVVAGSRSKDDVLREFAADWDRASRDDVISEEEFVEFFSEVSAGVDSDEAFVMAIVNAFHLTSI